MLLRLVPFFFAFCLVLDAGAAPQAPAKPSQAGQADERGIASWYGPEFQGRKTASGEVYDKEKLTAAHRTLPLGSYLRVMNLDNGSSVVVRINDRGPFAKNRLIDLSEAAARILGIIPTGTAEVSLTLIPKEEALAWRGGGIDGAPAADPPAADTAAAGAGSGAAPTSGAAVSGTGSAALALPRVRIQVASYTSESNARATVERLSLSGLRAIIQSASGRHRVVILDLSLQESRLAERRLDDLGYRGYTITTIRPASNP